MTVSAPVLLVLLALWTASPSNAFVPATRHYWSQLCLSSNQWQHHASFFPTLPLLSTKNKHNKEHYDDDDDDNDNDDENLVGFQQKLWNERISELIKYNKTFGTVNVPGTHIDVGDEYASLARFIKNCRERRNQLSRKQHDQLTAMGFLWDGADKEKQDERWEEMFQRLVDYNKTYGDFKVPNRWVDSKGVKLGYWVSKQHHFRNNGRMREDRRAKLDSIGFVWVVRAGGAAASRPDLGDKWERKRQELIQYYKQNGNYWVAVDRKNKKNPLNQLANWVHTQRQLYKNGNLEKDREKLLNEIDFVWDAKEQLDARWQAKFNQLKVVLEKESESHKSGKIYTVAALGKNLYSWVQRQRYLNEKGPLDPQRKAMLDKIGFEWT